MPPRKEGRRGAIKPESRMDRVERILEGLVQVVRDSLNTTTNAPEQQTITIERVLDEMTQYRGNSKKRSGGNLSIEQGSKRQSSGSSSGNSSTPQEGAEHQRNNTPTKMPTCPNCQKKHWGVCRRESTTCYKCGKKGHQIKNCPNKNRMQGVRMSASILAQ